MKKIIFQKYVLILIDLFAIFISYFLATILSNWYRGDDFHRINLQHLSYVKFLDVMFFITLFWQKQLYFKRRPNWEEVRIIYKLLLLILLINLPVIFIGNGNRTTFAVFLLFWLMMFITIPVLRSITKLILDNLGMWRRDLYIVGTSDNAILGYNLLTSSNLLGYSVKAFVDLKFQVSSVVVGDRVITAITLDELRKKSRFAEILICIEERHLSSHIKLINKLQQKFLSVMILPQMEGLPLYGLEINHFFGNEQLLLRLENNLSSRFNRITKRVFDYFVSLICLPVLFLVLTIVSFLIFVEDRGKPFFVQKRVGHGGKLFGCIKFRTMHKNAEFMLENWKNHNDPIYLEYVANNYKLINDPRVTMVGKILRKTSLDELPQIINVLLGQMSLVGPRPLLPGEVNDYPDGLFYYSQVSPGITGLWQISGRSKTSFKERCRLDSWYIKNWSLWYDVVVVIKTIQVVLKRDGAY